MSRPASPPARLRSGAVTLLQNRSNVVFDLALGKITDHRSIPSLSSSGGLKFSCCYQLLLLELLLLGRRSQRGGAGEEKPGGALLLLGETGRLASYWMGAGMPASCRRSIPASCWVEAGCRRAAGDRFRRAAGWRQAAGELARAIPARIWARPRDRFCSHEGAGRVELLGMIDPQLSTIDPSAGRVEVLAGLGGAGRTWRCWPMWCRVGSI